MRIGIDIRRAGAFGVGTYTKNLVRSLARIDPDNEYVLIGSAKHVQELGVPTARFGFAPYEPRYDAPGSHLSYGIAARSLRLDLLHVPHRWVPLSAPSPYVATLHDLNNVLFPPSGRRTWADRWSAELLRRVLRRARHTIAVSESTKQDAVKWLGLSPSRIRVVYDAVDDHVAQAVTKEERDRTLERYSIRDPFILYAGRIQVHKNLPRLIDAFAVVKARLENHPDYRALKLIIIGDDIGSLPEVRHAVMRTRVQDSVRFLGFVSSQTLRVFYDSARVFLFPSLYEGFGLPPLESMAHGTPVVTSNISSLPEAVGDAAELVNPENVFDIAKGLHRVLTDDARRAQLRARGMARVQTFSWDEAARRVLDVYRDAARRPRPSS